MKMRNAIVMAAAVVVLALSACGPDGPGMAPNPARSATVTETVAPSPTPSEAGAEDVSGNCDEVEHANDATCQAGGSPDDNSGSGSGNGSGGGSGSGYGS